MELEPPPSESTPVDSPQFRQWIYQMWEQRVGSSTTDSTDTTTQIDDLALFLSAPKPTLLPAALRRISIGPNGETRVTGNLSATGSIYALGGAAPPVAASSVYSWVQGTSPVVAQVESAASANNRISDVIRVSGNTQFRVVNDAYSLATTWMQVNGGYAAGVSSVAFTPPITMASTLGVTGTTTAAKINVTTSASTESIFITDVGVNGANIRLLGDGGTTPNKYIRSQGGNFQVINSAYSAAPLTLTDAGAMTITGPITLPVYTVATLPVGVLGARAFVNNALAPAFNAAVVGGGAVTVPVFYNGAAWTVG
ncbi:MAG: hypothetical protein ACK5XN_24595, partial [Bacteroidota bacterium]